MVAMSMNQLCGCTTPFTFGDIARGPSSCAIHTKGASSTVMPTLSTGVTRTVRPSGSRRRIEENSLTSFGKVLDQQG